MPVGNSPDSTLQVYGPVPPCGVRSWAVDAPSDRSASGDVVVMNNGFGVLGTTTMLKTFCTVPLLPAAWIVICVLLVVAVGVPEIAEPLRARPPGSVPWVIVHAH